MRTGTKGRLGAGFAAFVATIVAGLGFAAVAGADTYKGSTTQGEQVNLTVNKAGVPAKFVYGWDMECRGGGSLENGSTLSARFGPNADTNGFESKGSYVAEVERKFEAEIKVSVEGERRSETRFTGRFKLRAKVYNERTDELLARCSTGLVRWTADLKGGVVSPDPPSVPGSARFRG